MGAEDRHREATVRMCPPHREWRAEALAARLLTPASQPGPLCRPKEESFAEERGNTSALLGVRMGQKGFSWP